MNLFSALLALLLGYFIGAVPSGTIVARLYRNVDLTEHGSGRTGTTNVLRTLGPGAAAIAFAGDFFKGVLAVLVAVYLTNGSPWGQLLGGLAAVIGHTYSPWLGFKGGRGVVTGMAASLVAAPVPILVAAGVALLTVVVTRYVSLGSIVGASLGGALMVAMAFLTGEPAWAAWGILVGGFINLAHRDNIRRLLAGTERKLGESVNPA